MFRVSSSATFLGKLFHSLTIFTNKEFLKLFSFAGNGLSLWWWLACNGRKSCAKVKYSNECSPLTLLTVLEHSISEENNLWCRVGQLRVLKHSSYDISRPMFLTAYLDVLRCTFSKITESFLKCGDHTGEQYSSIGCTQLLYNFENNSVLLGPTVRLINPSMLVALFAHLLVCRLYDIFDVMWIPRSLTLD